VPVLIGLVAAGILVLGAGIVLVVVSFSGDGKDRPQEQASNERTTATATDDPPPQDPPRPHRRPKTRPKRKESPKTPNKPGPKVGPKPAPQPKPPPKPKPVKPPPEFVVSRAKQQKINRAIERGVAYLKASLTINATAGDPVPGNLYHQSISLKPMAVGIPVSHPGVPPLIGLTLLACGVPARDRVVQKAASLTRAAAGGLTHSYSLSTAILFLDRLADKRDRDLIRKMALQLVAGQTRAGGWDYNCRLLSRANQDKLLAFLRHPDRPVGANLRGLAVVEFKPGQKPVPRRGERDDNSNTQFAALALWAARKHSLPMERPLALVEARFRAGQAADGSWAYSTQTLLSSFRDPATCAGLLGLAVGRGSGKNPKSKLSADPCVRKGLAFLGKALGKPLLGAHEAEPPLLKPRGKYFGAEAVGDLYFLWSVERVAMIYQLGRIGGKDWYGWGSDVLLARQNANGSWTEWYPGVPDTCFALLFLKRNNLVPDLTSELQKLETTNLHPSP
jgi:hypothetical protein